jgi:hypothetical protein
VSGFQPYEGANEIVISTEATLRLAKEIAVERGWDCYEGGGA